MARGSPRKTERAKKRERGLPKVQVQRVGPTAMFTVALQNKAMQRQLNEASDEPSPQLAFHSAWHPLARSSGDGLEHRIMS